MSIESGRQSYDYFVTEQTDLFPFAAFDAAGRDLLGRIAGGGPSGTRYESMLSDDIEAVIFVRIPQIPSSRAFGQAPVQSIDEYNDRVPSDKSQWKIIPVAPRPFPVAMKDAEAPRDRPLPSLYALYAYGVLVVLCGIGIGRYNAGRHRRRSVPAPE